MHTQTNKSSMTAILKTLHEKHLNFFYTIKECIGLSKFLYFELNSSQIPKGLKIIGLNPLNLHALRSQRRYLLIEQHGKKFYSICVVPIKVSLKGRQKYFVEHAMRCAFKDMRLIEHHNSVGY
ncbi:hypothetical protein Q4567_06370 [Aliiglaciecola sp. 2_MG-2023]|uniref:hypothetical protein n=1 Tax=unclassified Aliiglaciecola TaxID=2593648 RepID=UPI0026E14C54|nr:MULTISPECIES: hypothetical protein [unclassified Aliiglaciecola]MDO6710335.1 hypothetical protein [Aliiglaciecola sp. 2_MG-2023]MDO6751482.1 hypothetical protein [Aliiglaciecola sp. 1_MG-2023]